MVALYRLTGRRVGFCVVAGSIGFAVPVATIGVLSVIIPIPFLGGMTAGYPATAIIIVIPIVIGRVIRIGVAITAAVPGAIIIVVITIAIINDATGKANSQGQYCKNFFHV